jgi:glycosyltransferase involved in cell wall biosynthesis
LAKTGDEVSVATLHAGSNEAADMLNGVLVYRLPVDNIYWPFDTETVPSFLSKLRWHAHDTWNSRASDRVARLLDREQPDVVNTHGLSGFSVAVWAQVKMRRIRLVHTLHDFYLLCRNSAFFRNGKVCSRRCRECAFVTMPRKWATSRVDSVVSISQYVLSSHLRYGRFQGVPASVIYNIVESAVKPSDADCNSISRPLVFGYIGRLEQEKGIDLLLEAAGRLNGDWRLRVAGSGKPSFVAQLKRRYSDPRIEWLGFVDAASFYQSIDVTVIPSVWPEPMGRTVIEAFAADRSVICARSGGIPEVAAFGKQVETYIATDVDALAAIMNSALRDGARWRRGGCRDEAAQSVFSEAYIVDRYRAIYSNAKTRRSEA